MRLERINLLKIAFWRNEVLPSLRSSHPTPVNIIPQIQWVKSFNLNTDNYFFIYSDEIYTHKVLIGYCGLDKVNRINKTAEMSLLINPQLHRKGYGKRAARKLLNYGFNKLKLQCIYIECYTTTSNWEFWKKVGFKEESRIQRGRKIKEKKIIGRNIL
jgi:RimJ/RimL family protein N-acetyltransferase